MTQYRTLPLFCYFERSDNGVRNLLWKQTYFVTVTNPFISRCPAEGAPPFLSFRTERQRSEKSACEAKGR